MNVRQDPELEKDTWEETMKELEKGWIWRDDSPSWKGKCVARRFGIHQGGKTRVIDDCSVCGLNQTVGLPEKFLLQAVDQMCSMICWSMKQAGGNKHPRVVGRTFDLKSAYKQFGLNQDDRNLIRIAVVEPATGIPVLFGVNSLPFGAVGSVAGFLRVSLATWYTGVAGLGLCWTGYFDDFSTLCRPELQNNTTWAVDSLFNLVGLDYAKEGAKAPEFSEAFKMLGVKVDTSGVSSSEVRVGHTDERKLELAAEFDLALEVKQLSSKGAERLRGRMVFYECFAAGRTTNLLLKNFGELCKHQRFVEDLTLDECSLILALKRRVCDALPILISPKFLDTWYIFTDGACEGESLEQKVGGIGGVLVSSNGTYVQHFGLQVPDDWMSLLLRHSNHPVHEVEVMPVLVSIVLWSRFIEGTQIVHYTDNDSCRYAFLKGVGATTIAKKLVASAMECENRFQLKSWYGRVPSHSNISDNPSRGSDEQLIAYGSQRAEVNLGEILNTWIPVGGNDGGGSDESPL